MLEPNLFQPSSLHFTQVPGSESSLQIMLLRPTDHTCVDSGALGPTQHSAHLSILDSVAMDIVSVNLRFSASYSRFAANQGTTEALVWHVAQGVEFYFDAYWPALLTCGVVELFLNVNGRRRSLPLCPGFTLMNSRHVRPRGSYHRSFLRCIW